MKADQFNDSLGKENLLKSICMVRCPCSFAGLKLQLFIEQSQYIPELSHAAGARVVIHDQGQMPFPDNEGNDVLPSRSTSFAIRKVSRDKRN